MKVIVAGDEIELGTTEAQPTIGIVDYSRRETDDFGVTTVVRRGFARRMSVRAKVPFEEVSALQRTLADLRAQPVQWVADERFNSLSFMGFYKDFSLDLAVPPISFCTLTIEGLAETEAAADPGGDPATDGQISTLQLLQSVAITDGVLTATNVPENDQPVWSAGTTYPYGARVIRAHRQWESLVVANLGNEPGEGSAQWADIGPTNRWAMFDDALGTLTQAAGSIVVTLDPVEAVNAIALLDVTAASVRVEAAGYDWTAAPSSDAGTALFLDMPATTGPITVTITGAGTVSVGTLMMGNLVGLGITEASPTAAITDYSRKETDEFGDVTVVERAWAKRMDARALLRTDAVDMVFNRIATVRGRPCLWIGAPDIDALSAYGFFKDFSIEIGENVSTLSLSVEGLSKAAQLAPINPNPILVTIFKNAATPPTKPAFNSGEVPSGWTLAPTVIPSGQYRWATQAQFLVGQQQTPWTDPVTVGGVSWQDVVDDDPAHPKPEDGATVGATPEQAEQLAEQSDMLAQLALDLAAAEETVAAVQTQVDTDLAAINTEIDTINASIIDLSEEIVGISSAANPNQMENGGFENGLTGWTQFGNTGWALVAAGAQWGTHANLSATGTLALGKTAPASAGLQYTFAADVRTLGATDGTAALAIRWLDASGAAIGADTFGPNIPANTDFNVSDSNRKTYKVTATAPAGATQALCFVQFGSIAGPTNLGVRRAKFERGDKATAFSSEASSYSVYQTGISNSGLIAGLNTEVNTPGGRVQQALNATTALTGSLATLTNTLRATGNPNLIPNGSFENGLSGWVTNLSGWSVATNNIWGTYAYNQSNIANGTDSLIYTDIAASSGTYTLTYDAAFNISGGTGTLIAQVQWLGAGDALIGYADAPGRVYNDFGFDTGLVNRDASKFTVTAAAGTVKLRVVFYFKKTSGTSVEHNLRLVKLEAGSISTAYSGDASLRQAYTVMVGMNAQLSELNTEVMTPGGRVGVLQSSMTTALGNVALLQQNVTTGSGNLLPQSSFAAPGWPAGWSWYSPTPASYSNGASVSRDGAGDAWRPGGNFGANQGEHTFAIQQVNGNTGDWGQLHTDRVAVQGNKWYSFELFQAAHRANCGIKIEWYTAANGFISATDAGYVTVGTGGTDINAWTNRYVKGKAPANAAFAVPVAYKGGTYAGQGDSWMWITRPMLREVTSAYVGPSAYVPSGDRASVEVIQRSVDGVVAQWGVALNVAGKIVGRVRLDGNASTSTFDVEADAMSVTKSGGGPSLTWTNGALIVNDGL